MPINIHVRRSTWSVYPTDLIRLFSADALVETTESDQINFENVRHILSETSRYTDANLNRFNHHVGRFVFGNRDFSLGVVPDSSSEEHCRETFTIIHDSCSVFALIFNFRSFLRLKIVPGPSNRRCTSITSRGSSTSRSKTKNLHLPSRSLPPKRVFHAVSIKAFESNGGIRKKLIPDFAYDLSLRRPGQRE